MNEAAALVGLPLPAEERRTLRRNAAGLAFALLGGAVATAVLGAVLVAPMMALLIALILVVCACAVLLRRDVSLVSPLSLAIVTFVLSYCVRPLYLSLRGDVESIADRVNPELFMPALGLVLAFVLSFVSGHLAPWGVRLARFFPVPKTTWARGRVLIVQALLGALSVVLYLVLLRLSGMSLGAAFLQPTDFRAVTSAEGLFYISGLLLWSMWAIFFLESTWRAPDGVTALGLPTSALLAGRARRVRRCHWGARVGLGTRLIWILAGCSIWRARSRGSACGCHTDPLLVVAVRRGWIRGLSRSSMPAPNDHATSTRPSATRSGFDLSSIRFRGMFPRTSISCLDDRRVPD